MNYFTKNLIDKETDGLYINNLDQFLAETDNIQKLTGFTGSACTLYIHKDLNNKLIFYIFVDGRYLEQAKNECNKFFSNKENLDYKINLIKGKEDIYNWFIENKEQLKIKQILCCYETCTFSELERLRQIVKIQNLPLEEVKNEKTEFQVNFKQRKISELCRKIKENNYLIISDPAIVCWLFGIIGTDQPYSNIKNCYCIVESNKIHLFIDLVDDNISKLSKNIQIHSMQEIKAFILDRKKSFQFLLDSKMTNGLFFEWIENYKEYSTKNFYSGRYSNKEIKSTRLAHINDAKIINKFLQKIDEMTKDGSIYQLTEQDLSDILDQKSKKYNAHESFPTISAFGKNSALPHYHHSQDNAKIQPNNIYLIDSGRQHLNNSASGTTDITRTIIIGEPTEEMKQRYTLVLKSHINAVSNKIPKGTIGKEIDELTRSYFDFPHSTGHGVSFCGRVHDILPRISPNSDDKIKSNMVFSIEPGLYVTDEYGIRIENLYYTKKAKKFLKLIPLTLAQFDKKLINLNHLTKKEKAWLDNYQKLLLSKELI